MRQPFPESGEKAKERENLRQAPASSAEANMPEEEMLADLADLFRIFGDSTRIRILCALFDKEMCVGDIGQMLGMTQSAISHQLRILKQAKLVKSRRQGKEMYYALADHHVRMIIGMGIEHLEE